MDQPWAVAAQVSLAPKAAMSDVAGPIRQIIRRELAAVGAFAERLIRGELHVC